MSTIHVPWRICASMSEDERLRLLCAASKSGSLVHSAVL